MRLAQQPVEQVAQQHDGEDGDAADREQQPRHVLLLAADVVHAPAPSSDAVALRHLWARQRIAQLGDDEALVGGQAQREPITALGLRYGLLTAYTSFIAVDQVVRTHDAALPVVQPLPLPQGVSALAVGAESTTAGTAIGAVVPTTPEPAWPLALAATVCVMAALAWRRRRIVAAWSVR